MTKLTRGKPGASAASLVLSSVQEEIHMANGDGNAKICRRGECQCLVRLQPGNYFKDSVQVKNNYGCELYIPVNLTYYRFQSIFRTLVE